MTMAVINGVPRPAPSCRSSSVYVMTARPGRIKRRLAVELPRPRSIEETTSVTFNELKRELLALIREESLKAAGVER